MARCNASLAIRPFCTLQSPVPSATSLHSFMNEGLSAHVCSSLSALLETHPTSLRDRTTGPHDAAQRRLPLPPGPANSQATEYGKNAWSKRWLKKIELLSVLRRCLFGSFTHASFWSIVDVLDVPACPVHSAGPELKNKANSAHRAHLSAFCQSYTGWFCPGTGQSC